MPKGHPAWCEPLRKLSDTEAAWMAAALDCEGTISFCVGRSEFNVVVRIEMCNRDFIESVGKICGGWTSLDKPQKGRRRAHSLWQVSSNGARWLLPQVYPYMIIKKRHAELLLEFLSFTARGKRRTLEHEQRAFDIREEMWRLNERGKQGRLIWANRVTGFRVIQPCGTMDG